jgi:hypothetical protein
VHRAEVGQRLRTRVARWHSSKPKIPIWVNFGVFCIEMAILWPFGIFYS